MGIRNAFTEGYSHDLQWSGAHLTALHLDPYHQYLIHDPQHLLRTTQVPNYLHELYILLLPLGWMTYPTANAVWVVLNCFFIVAILFQLRRLYALSGPRTLLLGLLLLTSTPYRIAMASGTQSFLTLLCFTYVLSPTASSVRRGLALGLSYSKYSFSPVLFLYLAIRRSYRVLAISLLPPALGLLIMWRLVSHGEIGLFAFALEPFAVSRVGVASGAGDIMVLCRYLATGRLSEPHIAALTYLGALGGSIFIAWWVSRLHQASPQRIAAALATGSLICFTHLPYDYIFLLVPLAACLSGRLDRAKIVVIAAISFLWYVTKVLPHPSSGLGNFLLELITFLMLILILTFTAREELDSL